MQTRFLKNDKLYYFDGSIRLGIVEKIKNHCEYNEKYKIDDVWIKGNKCFYTEDELLSKICNVNFETSGFRKNRSTKLTIKQREELIKLYDNFVKINKNNEQY